MAYPEPSVAATNLPCLGKVKRIAAFPITADGVVHTATAVVQLRKHETAKHIASSLCDSICEAKTIANIAGASGLRLVLSSSFEIEIGVGTNIHVACSSDSTELPCEVGIGPEYDNELAACLEDGNSDEGWSQGHVSREG